MKYTIQKLKQIKIVRTQVYGLKLLSFPLLSSHGRDLFLRLLEIKYITICQI